MNLSNLSKLGKQVVDKASEAVNSQASGLTEQALRAAIDQTITVLQMAAKQVKARNLPSSKVSIGTQLSIGVVQLSMQLEVPTHGEDPEDINVDLKLLEPAEPTLPDEES